MATDLTLRRAFTETALRRRYEANAIEWRAFDPARHPEPAREAAAGAFAALAAAEYAAAATSTRILEGLFRSGAPIDVLAEAARVPGDELRHADCALRMAGLCAGAPREASVSHERAFAPRSAATTPIALDAVMADAFAVGESLAIALLTASMEAATDEAARALYASLLGDEIHHARLGWYYLEWRAPLWTEGERQGVANQVAAVVADVAARDWGAHPVRAGFDGAARALGVLSAAERADAIRDVMEAEILPGLDALGLGSSRAWAQPRGGVSSNRDM